MNPIHLCIVVTTLASVCIGAAKGDTQRGFRCEDVWTANSSSNSIGACIGNWQHLTTDYAFVGVERGAPLVFGLISIIAGLLIIIWFPLLLMGRYCCGCCGSYRRRPGAACCCGGAEWDDKSEAEKNAAYPASEVRTVKAGAFIILVLTVCALILTLAGISSLQAAFTAVFTNGLGIITWANAKIDNVRTGMTLPDDNGNLQLIPPLTNGMFWDMYNKTGQFQSQITNLQSVTSQYLTQAEIGALCIACGPTVFVLVTVLCAVFDIRKVIPLINSILHAIFVIPYGVLGGLFVILSVFITDLDAERTRFLASPYQPGLFSEWAVPYLGAGVPFQEIATQVSQAEQSSSISGCRSLQTICSNTDSFNSAKPNVVYVCANLRNPATDCTTLDALTTQMGSLHLMTGATTVCTGAASQAACTIVLCASTCNNSAVKNASATSNKNLIRAQHARSSYQTYVAPLLDFTVIVTQLLSFITVFTSLKYGFLLTGVGLMVFGYLFILDLVVLLRGQKRFFKLEPVAPADGDAPMEQVPAVVVTEPAAAAPAAPKAEAAPAAAEPAVAPPASEPAPTVNQVPPASPAVAHLPPPPPRSPRSRAAAAEPAGAEASAGASNEPIK